MDLYQPLFADRPVVVPEMFAGLQPRVHEADLGMPGPSTKPAAAFSGGFGGGGFGAGGFGGGGFQSGGGLGGSNGFNSGVNGGAGGNQQDQAPLNLKQGVASAAQAAEVGELFRYTIAKPVDLARQKTALLPIVNDSVTVEKLSLFNSAVEPRHPMNAARLTNDTKLHLMQGPITVFDGGEYAGDAQIEDLAPGARRLVTYGLDLDVEIATSERERPSEILTVAIADGRLQLMKKLVNQQSYAIKNSSDKKKKILIESLRNTEWTLLENKQLTELETTHSFVRLGVEAAAKATTKLTMLQERVLHESVELASLSVGGLSASSLGVKSVNAADIPG